MRNLSTQVSRKTGEKRFPVHKRAKSQEEHPLVHDFGIQGFVQSYNSRVIIEVVCNQKAFQFMF